MDYISIKCYFFKIGAKKAIRHILILSTLRAPLRYKGFYIRIYPVPGKHVKSKETNTKRDQNLHF